ncbi:MAG: hypothetical protein M9894_14875 [Planctomycetes bacterium]|nr:hypothetical protein [Planctomycetota bacterium]
MSTTTNGARGRFKRMAEVRDKRDLPGWAHQLPAWALDSVAHLPAAFGIDVASRETGLSPHTLRRYVASGRLRALRTAAPGSRAGRVIVPRLALAQLLASLADAAPGAAP